MIKIGITGSIGSGKSYVSQKIRQIGIPVYDCDAEAKKIMISSPEIRKKLTDLLGEHAYTKEGNLNKKLIAAYLFASEDHARRINSVVHPAVKANFEKWSASQQSKAVCMECAILFESNFDKLVDAVIVISAPKSLCISRAIARDGTTKAEIERRMSLQISDKERSARTPFVIVNDGTGNIDASIEEVLTRIRSSFYASF